MKNRQFLALLCGLVLAVMATAYPQTDHFSGKSVELSSPGSHHFAITPSDATDFTVMARGIYVGTGGDVAIVTSDGTAVTYVGAASGSVIPMRAKRVNSTNTTADDLVGMW